MILRLIDAPCACAHLWGPGVNFIIFRAWRAWLKCYHFIALGANGWRDHYVLLCGQITRHVLCVCGRAASLWTCHFQNPKQQHSRWTEQPCFKLDPVTQNREYRNIVRMGEEGRKEGGEPIHCLAFCLAEWALWGSVWLGMKELPVLNHFLYPSLHLIKRDSWEPNNWHLTNGHKRQFCSCANENSNQNLNIREDYSSFWSM